MAQEGGAFVKTTFRPTDEYRMEFTATERPSQMSGLPRNSQEIWHALKGMPELTLVEPEVWDRIVMQITTRVDLWREEWQKHHAEHPAEEVPPAGAWIAIRSKKGDWTAAKWDGQSTAFLDHMRGVSFTKWMLLEARKQTLQEMAEELGPPPPGNPGPWWTAKAEEIRLAVLAGSPLKEGLT